MRFYNHYLKSNNQVIGVLDHLYTPLPGSIIKSDLEFVAHHWKDHCFDLWEEVLGRHFYTLMVQRASMVKGAEFARARNDTGAALFYEKQAKEMKPYISRHFSQQKNHIMETLEYQDWDRGKSGLDIASILAVLHSRSTDFFGPADERIMATAYSLIETFRPLYPVNKMYPSLGVSIGRYPEDKYDGVAITKGNPWYIGFV